MDGVFEDKKIDYDSRQNRNRAILKIDQDKILQEIAKRIIKIVGVSNHSFENDMQVFEQQEGGEIFLHSDSLANDGSAKRIMSILFYLNDGYEGGYLDFPYIKTRISPAKGMMMCFPIINKYGEQTPDFSHSASVITKGRKLMCYLTLNSSIKVSRMPDNS